MKKVISFFRKTHKITGTAIAVFFVMWFITGIVLIYHPYPKVSEKLLYSKKETLPSSLPDLSSVLDRTDGKMKSLSLKQYQGQTLFSIDKAPVVTFSVVEQVAKHWINAPIERVDTLK